jgi:hypothetical protein
MRPGRMHTVLSMVFQFCFCCIILFRRRLLGGFCILREELELSGAVPACSEHQHLKNLYLYIAGSVFILQNILIARRITTEEESTTVGIGTGFN